MKKANRVWLLGFLLLFGCASMFMKGGDLAPRGYKPQKVLAAYKAEGAVPQGVEYLLIETEKGPAIFERSPDGSGALFLTRWKDERGDHFAGWVATSHGYEFVKLGDGSGKVEKYVYPKGYYSVKEIGGISRPVPVVKVDPVAMLIPK